MMEINLEKLKIRMCEIRENKEKIQKYATIPEKEFWKDERNILSIKHLLLQSIEAIGSICNHISAKKFLRAPSSFPECFEILSNSKVIDNELSLKLRKMARFRNILVHRYWEIEDQKILDYARNSLEDFDRFLKSVTDYLGISGGSSNSPSSTDPNNEK